MAKRTETVIGNSGRLIPPLSPTGSELPWIW